jgi:hypothetical protein
MISQLGKNVEISCQVYFTVSKSLKESQPVKFCGIFAGADSLDMDAQRLSRPMPHSLTEDELASGPVFHANLVWEICESRLEAFLKVSDCRAL